MVDISIRLPSGERHRERRDCPLPRGRRLSDGDKIGSGTCYNMARRSLRGRCQTQRDLARVRGRARASQPVEAERHRIKGSDRPGAPGSTARGSSARRHLHREGPATQSSTQRNSTEDREQRAHRADTMIKKAVEWGVLERMPCTIRLLPLPPPSAAFHDFDEFERLVQAAKNRDHATYLVVLLAGERRGCGGARSQRSSGATST